MSPLPLSTLLPLVFVILIVILAVRGLKIVRQSETLIIERLGRFHRMLDSGVHIIWPIVDSVRARIDLRETAYDFPRQNVITKDNVVIEINALLYYQTIDPARAVYEIANLGYAIEKLTQTSLRNVIGDMELDQVLTSRDVINKKLQEILDEATEKWGVKVNRVELQDISPPEDIRAAMEKQMRAERDRRAAILEAEGMKRSQILKSEGERESAVNRAEGVKEATVLEAEGQAKARLLAAEAEANAIRVVTGTLQNAAVNPAQYLVAVKYLETLKTMSAGTDSKLVFMPYEAAATLGAAGSLKEVFETALPKAKG